MSSENVEIVSRGIDAFNRGEWDLTLDLFHPKIEWHDAPGLPGATVHHGFARVVAFWKGMEEAFEGFSIRPERYFDAGDDVVAFLQSGGRGRSSGMEIRREMAFVFTLSEGLVVKVVGYDDRAAALAAVGLADQPGIRR
jgi:ketosteroid isomerase-like protein